MIDRRAMLARTGLGFGTLALAGLLADEGRLYGDEAAVRIDPKAKAKRVIFLFMGGGPSHLETFDPKPLLNKLDGQPRPAAFGEARYQFVRRDARLLGSAQRFRRHGASGTEVSDLFPRLARCVDDIAVLRSCYGDRVVHSAAQYELFSGRVVPGFPSLGSWAVYGLGTVGRSLPGGTAAVMASVR